MLGTEQQPQLDPGRRAQQVDVAPALPVHPRLVGEQRDALAGHEVDRVGEQHLDPRPNLRGQRSDAGQQPQQREMMRTHWLLVLAVVLGCAGGPAVGRSAPPVPPPSPVPPSVDSLLASLTVRQKVAQLVMPRLSGSYTAFDDSLFQVAARWVDSLEIGGVIVFTGSPFDIATKLNALQRRSRVPLLVSADLEWGAGMRVVGGTSFPHIMAVGATGDAHDAYTIAAAAASEGRAVGIHINFAPDADVNNNPANPIINTRSFGEDPRAVSRLVREYVRGLHEYGMLATIKHFPGHGDTQTDSHIGLPVIAAGYPRLDSLELVPFRAGIAAGADVVMSAHIAFPALTGSNDPGTMSAAVLTGLLRDSLHFRGLVVTDALDMGAIVTAYGAGEAAGRAFLAGSDLLLIPADPDSAVNAMAAAVESGRIAPAHRAARLDHARGRRQAVAGRRQRSRRPRPHAGARRGRAAARVARETPPHRPDRVRRRAERRRRPVSHRPVAPGRRHRGVLPALGPVGTALLRFGARGDRAVARHGVRRECAAAVRARHHRTSRLPGPAHHRDRRGPPDGAGVARQPLSPH